VAKIGEKWGEMARLPDMETKEYGYVGCKFVARCPYAKDICRQIRPPKVQTEDNREVMCFKLVDYQHVESPTEPVPVT
jgi:peptide/nickel transport system ATP-binding protein